MAWNWLSSSSAAWDNEVYNVNVFVQRVNTSLLISFLISRRTLGSGMIFVICAIDRNSDRLLLGTYVYI